MFGWWRRIKNDLSEREAEVNQTSQNVVELKANIQNLATLIAQLEANDKCNRSERKRLEFKLRNRLLTLERKLPFDDITNKK